MYEHREHRHTRFDPPECRGRPPPRQTTSVPQTPAVTLGHGVRSPLVYGALAELLTVGLLNKRPDLAAYPEAVAGWATAEAQATLVMRHLEQVGTFHPETGEPRGSTLNWLRNFERLAAKHRQTLGLDPRSEAELTRERAAAMTLGGEA